MFQCLATIATWMAQRYTPSSNDYQRYLGNKMVVALWRVHWFTSTEVGWGRQLHAPYQPSWVVSGHTETKLNLSLSMLWRHVWERRYIFTHFSLGSRWSSEINLITPARFPPCKCPPFSLSWRLRESYTWLRHLRNIIPLDLTRIEPCIAFPIDFFLNNQPDALIIQIYFVIKLYMFRASLTVIRSFLLYVRQW